MSEAVQYQTAEDFIVEHDPRADGLSSPWVCIDDRPVEPGEGLGLYKQIAGGALGAATDALVAAELATKGHVLVTDHNGKYIGEGWNIYTTDAAASDLTDEAHETGVDLRLHEVCAAEDYAVMIATNLVIPSNHPSIFAAAREIYPNLSEDDFEDAVEVYRGLLSQGAILSSDVAAEHMEGKISRVGLVTMPHKAGTLISNHVARTAFDNAGALEAGVPAYHASFGDMSEITPSAHDLLSAGSREEFHAKFLAASAIRHGAVALALPRPEGPDTPLDIRLFTN
jgi:hypothetical protein